MTLIISFVVISIILFFVWKHKNKNKWQKPTTSFPEAWRPILIEKVNFYNALNTSEQTKFEYQIQEFLLNCKVTGIKTTVDITDKILVASSAVIPVFGFDHWTYTSINEVLIYPNSFNKDYKIEGENRFVLGMVGTGAMNGIMILSKKALHQGFKNDTDKKNTAIHEFVHLIDKTGGPIDGVPSVLMEKQFAIPWIDLINKEIEEIYKGTSDINPYGGTNRAEFFSVISEYFFERPKLLKRKHPELYALLEKIFNQDMASRNLQKKVYQTHRNTPCPCNSGKKFKKCCGK
ncbi:zinc-dependent peptidase [Tamlana agarivorans]|uniref:Zinc-dependent peptidase n=1 Tax=Pseudotamlana agarivorans TaxID=481183 RepID=A0ACC5U4D5_9FLAO|nr:M90 family metallopeptidase [Tamlana agarivorans]MBU2949185.1 zinc-dependent peptidase [Tamlana agarivorans]